MRCVIKGTVHQKMMVRCQKNFNVFRSIIQMKRVFPELVVKLIKTIKKKLVSYIYKCLNPHC